MQLTNREEMRELFMTPSLPFKEYIVEHGLHHITQSKSVNGKDETLADHFYADYLFPDQLVSVSLIHGPLFHCSLEQPYEWRASDLSRGKQEEPIGYQTDEDLYIFLTKVIGGSYVFNLES
jgi:hypothetical protein